MPTIALLGTFDTKGEEYDWVRRRIVELGCEVVMIDCGTFDSPIPVDITAAELAAQGGSSLDVLRADDDRGAAMGVMTRGAGRVLARLEETGAINAVLSFGGSGGSSVAGGAMHQLSIGFPKLLVSTMASGDVAPYVGTSDVTLMYSVVDIAGMNGISRTILGNAAAAVVGMVSQVGRPAPASEKSRQEDSALIAATMFGVTTEGVSAARAQLEGLGYEVIVFHATGSGGRAMERLIDAGYFAGVLDLTTTELADDLVGGVLSAGPDRLSAAGRTSTPQVVSLGALDMVNFGPHQTVPVEFKERRLLVHNETVTLMRTTAAEMRELGRIVADKLRAAKGPTTLLVPRQGVSAIDRVGAPFHDVEADQGLFDEVTGGLADSQVRIINVDQNINDQEFAKVAADELHRLITDRVINS